MIIYLLLRCLEQLFSVTPIRIRVFICVRRKNTPTKEMFVIMRCP